MIRPPGWDGVAFSERSDGNIRDTAARAAAATRLGVVGDWAEVRQVHGNDVVRVSAPGEAGEADAIWTTVPDVPLAIFTADCFGVVLTSPRSVGVAHAGWRGAVGGVVERLRSEMTAGGHEPRRAALGPGIGPCCFEVGPEVGQQFDGHTATTTRGAASVDLPGVLVTQLAGLELWAADGCTFHEEGWFSHRADGTVERLASIGWLP
jgi:hypothetical protein